MLETVVGAIAAPIFEQLWQLGGSAIADVKKTSEKVEATNQLLAACKQYEKRYHQRHGLMKMMPALMKESILLESVYTAVKLLDEISVNYFRTEQDLEAAFRQSGRRSFQLGTDKRLDGMEIANQKQYLMVLGGPGIGKSTFLKKLGLESLKPESKLQQQHIPVLIELKALKDSNVDLAAAIANEFAICGFPEAGAFTIDALEQGKLLVLLDGLDEVPKHNFNPVAQQLENLVDRYPHNRFVASCRIAAYNSTFRSFSDVTIAEFDDEQIQQFIVNWFSSELDQQEKTAEQYWQLLSQPEHKATKELAQTPLLLTFLCLVYDREQTLPKTRSKLYSRALNILLQEWAAQKRLERDPIYEGFHPGLEEELLAQIAYDSFAQDQLFFSKAEVTKQIVAFLADTLDAPRNLDGGAVLSAIEVQQGILVERAEGVFSFSHLTLQEYLSALYIVGHDRVQDTVAQHALDHRWREVFLLVAGLLRGQVQKLWLSLEQIAFSYIAASEKVEHLIRWADSITDAKYKNLEIRATALCLASNIASNIASASNIARASARASASASNIASNSDIEIVNNMASHIVSNIASAIDRARTIDINSTNDTTKSTNIKINSDIINMDIDSASAIDIDIDSAIVSASNFIEMQVFRGDNFSQLPEQLSQLKRSRPNEQESSQKWNLWADRLETLWLNSYNLTREAVSLSTEDAKALANYLYVTELIVRCKESAVRVSKQEWEALESRLLTLKGYQS